MGDTSIELLVVTPDEQWVLGCATDPKSTRLFALATDGSTRDAPLWLMDNCSNQLVLSPDGTQLALSTQDTLWVMDLRLPAISTPVAIADAPVEESYIAFPAWAGRYVFYLAMGHRSSTPR